MSDERIEAEDLLEQHGVKLTANRIIVARELLSADCPLSLSDLETRLETLDKSSIFRVITLLTAHDVIHGVEDGKGVAKYEICHGHHHTEGENDMHAHFYCEKCGRVECLHGIPATAPPLPDGFRALSVNFMIKGICRDCNNKN